MSKTVSIDKASKRINIPSYFVELYFIAWCIFLFIVPGNSVVTYWLSCYFLAESFFWLLYYFFFRRFFEERYAIMHSLEYIVLLPLLIVTQARSLAIILHTTFSTAFVTLFFPSNQGNVYLVILSVLYTALIFGIFLSNLPIEHVKERGGFKYDLSIVGNGDIVRNRLLSAISTSDTKHNVAIFDINPIPQNKAKQGTARLSYFQMTEESSKNILASKILWIATPPYAHLYYLNKYLTTSFIAVEKPITISKTECHTVNLLRHSGVWNRVFCLSYYYLEKGLPLTYLYNPLSFYENYLDFNMLSREKVLSMFEQLGRLKSIQLCLMEGEDSRQWVESESSGGHLLETFLHIAVMARMLTFEDQDWGTPSWTVEHRNGHYMSYIRCSGQTAHRNVLYDLQMGKFVPKELQKRGGRMDYENGYILVDFGAQQVDVRFGDETGFIISTKQEFSTKYSIQLDMVERCFEEGITPSIVDGVDLQLETLSWIFSQKENEIKIPPMERE